MSRDILTTLHPENNNDINLYPNIKRDNIPNKAINSEKLNDDIIDIFNHIQEEISSVKSGSPSYVSTESAILASSTDKGMAVATDTGHWYYWNGIQYVDSGKLYQATGFNENEIYPDYTKFAKGTINVNSADIDLTGYFWANGSKNYNANWSCNNNLIKIHPSRTYTIYNVTNYHFDLFGIDGTFKRHIDSTSVFTFTTNADEYYIGMSVQNSEKPYFLLTDYDKIININDLKFLDDGNVIELDEIDLINTYFDGSGNAVYNENWCGTSKFKKCNPNAIYKANATSFVVTFDENYNFIRQVILQSSIGYTMKTISSEKYMKISVEKANINKYTLLSKTLDNNPIIIKKTIKKNGTIGTDCDYTDIASALNDITDNSYFKQYYLEVLEGEYDYSNNGNNIGIMLKNYVTISGVNKGGVIIKKLENSYSDSKNAVDINPNEFIFFTSIKNCTIITNNCKAPLHIDDSYHMFGEFIGENLDLINLQAKGTGDFPVNGTPNCAAFGTAGSIIKLINVRANGKLWCHNNIGKNSGKNSMFYLENCNCRNIEVGDLLSYKNDKLILKGNKFNEFKYIWFSDYSDLLGIKKPSWDCEFSGNIVNKTTLEDHANTYDVLSELFDGKYPFQFANIDTYCYTDDNINIGDICYKVSNDNLTEVTNVDNGNEVIGVAVETPHNKMLLVEKR